MANSDRDDSTAAMLGRLIRSYRIEARRNGRRLSQDGLIDLMIERGESYAANLDRSSVSRWETGARLAPQEFLIAFGRALKIPSREVDWMMQIAGYEDLPAADDSGKDKEEREAVLTATRGIESKLDSLRRDVRALIDSTTQPDLPADARPALKSALRRLAPLAVWILAVGIFLDAMGMNGTLALLAYVLGALAIAAARGILRWLKPDRSRPERENVVDLYFFSLFFTLNAPGLIGTLTKTDHFGFYTVETFTNTPMPFLFAMLVNLELSLVASVIFSLSWDRLRGAGPGGSALVRSAWVALPPLLFAYANLVAFTNLGAWMYFLIVFGILFGAFTIIVAFNESETALGEMDVVLRAAIVATAALTLSGLFATFVGYMEPGLAVTAAEFRIIPLREVSAEDLGYASEYGSRLMGVGILWQSLAAILYLVIVVGGYLILTIRRAASRRDASAPLPTPPSDA